MRRLAWKIAGLSCLWGFFSCAQIMAQPSGYFLNSPTMQKYVVILGGAAAEKKYEQRFRKWSLTLHDTLTRDYDYSTDHITLLLGKGDPTEPKISGACRQETIEQAIQTLQNKVQPGDQILFFFVGHGTSDEEVAKFNIVGPDITGQRFAEMLDGFLKQDIIVVNTTSSSYLFSTALSKPGRVLISATRGQAEKYDTTFAPFFIDALANHAGDRDKNTRVSIWEAFQYARTLTEKWYSDQGRLPTEHSTLDDNGDALFSTDPDPTKDDGRLAQIAYVDLLKVSLPDGISAGEESETARLLMAQMLDLERSVLLLRSRKTEMLAKDYKQQLEPLLIALARTTRKLRLLQATSKEAR